MISAIFLLPLAGAALKYISACAQRLLGLFAMLKCQQVIKFLSQQSQRKLTTCRETLTMSLLKWLLLGGQEQQGTAVCDLYYLSLALFHMTLYRFLPCVFKHLGFRRKQNRSALRQLSLSLSLDVSLFSCFIICFSHADHACTQPLRVCGSWPVKCEHALTHSNVHIFMAKQIH